MTKKELIAAIGSFNDDSEVWIDLHQFGIARIEKVEYMDYNEVDDCSSIIISAKINLQNISFVTKEINAHEKKTL